MFRNWKNLLFDKNKEGEGGGGGGGGKTVEEKLAELEAKNTELAGKLAELEKKKSTKKSKSKDDDEEDDSEDDDEEDDDKDNDLRGKARKEREASEKNKTDVKRIEKALSFTTNVANFVKENKESLPAEIEGILKAAERETYDTAIEKSAALKSAFVQSFFAVQANVDMLTTAQKFTLEDWQKLTKKAREDKAEFVYENIFEPAIETLKKVKKAEEVGKSRAGFANSSDSNEAYKTKLMNLSKKTHLGQSAEK